jgi:hypothetical protein
MRLFLRNAYLIFDTTFLFICLFMFIFPNICNNYGIFFSFYILSLSVIYGIAKGFISLVILFISIISKKIDSHGFNRLIFIIVLVIIGFCIFLFAFNSSSYILSKIMISLLFTSLLIHIFIANYSNYFFSKNKILIFSYNILSVMFYSLSSIVLLISEGI